MHEKLVELLRFVDAYWSTHQHAPSLDAIQRAFSISSKSVAWYRVKIACDNGWLERCAHCPNAASLKLTQAGLAVAA